MNKRMHAIVKYIEPGRGLIDVGTDHGHLPAWMAAHGYRGNIIAADINAAPLQRPERTRKRPALQTGSPSSFATGWSNAGRILWTPSSLPEWAGI